MHKIKSVFNPDVQDTNAFAALSSVMLICFAGGAALISFSQGTIGFIVMGSGLLLSFFIWTAFFANYS